MCFSFIIAEVVERSKEAYNQAMTLAQSEMPSTHPIRLGLALNFSVFHYEIKNDPSNACELAKKVYIVLVYGSCFKGNNSVVLHCTEPFIITIPSSRYDLKMLKEL